MGLVPLEVLTYQQMMFNVVQTKGIAILLILVVESYVL